MRIGARGQEGDQRIVIKEGHIARMIHERRQRGRGRPRKNQDRMENLVKENCGLRRSQRNVLKERT